MRLRRNIALMANTTGYSPSPFTSETRPDKLGFGLGPGRLGFDGDEATGWTKPASGNRLVFRLLHQLDDLVPVEQLQVDVFGVGERDVIPASELVVVAETGGDVIGAFSEHDDGDLFVGALVGWGGYVSGVPRIVSDLLAVQPARRDRGIGEDLKRLQAGIAIQRGFREIVWTVDPLRAANARLNVAKLGATAHRYERNRYGDGFGVGLYGGMPTDRLHMVWDLASERTWNRLLGVRPEPFDLESLPRFSSGSVAPSAVVEIPPDIDALVQQDQAAALALRIEVRSALEQAFAEGLEITGFEHLGGRSAYVLTPRTGTSS